MSTTGTGEVVPLEKVHALAHAIALADRAGANGILDELTTLRESDLPLEAMAVSR